MSDLISRVQELQRQFDAPAPVRTPASASSTTDATDPSAGASGAGDPSFQKVLNQAQGGGAPPAVSIGTMGASQMPTSAGGQPSGPSPLSALGSGGLGLLGGWTPGSSSSPLDLSGSATGLGSGLGLSNQLSELSSLDGSGDPTSLGGSGSLFGSAADPSLSANGSSLGSLLDNVANQVGVSPALAKAVAATESNFNPAAVSPAGAQGLMQLMPSTFSQYAGGGQGPAGRPVQGTVTQPFGPTSLVSEPPLQWNGKSYPHFHTGVDIGVSQGTPIRATMAGTVEVRADPEGYGNLIVVRNGPWDVLYGHTSGRPASIQTGVPVQPGEIIGYAGSTGNSTGPHVHYEIRHDGQTVDPAPFMASAAPANPLNPVANAQAGVSYLKDLLNQFGNNVPKALAAYNAGPAAVQKYGGVPPYPETQAYVQKALQYARSFGA